MALDVLLLLNGTISVKKFAELDARRVVNVAKSTGLTFYDASYLTLALMSNETLATEDKELSEEARKMGIKAVSA